MKTISFGPQPTEAEFRRKLSTLTKKQLLELLVNTYGFLMMVKAANDRRREKKPRKKARRP